MLILIMVHVNFLNWWKVVKVGCHGNIAKFEKNVYMKSYEDFFLSPMRVIFSLLLNKIVYCCKEYKFFFLIIPYLFYIIFVQLNKFALKE